MALIYSSETGKPVIKIGRVAGQYAKPRSQEFESDGTLTFKGDIIHSIDDRTPDPERMFTAYFHSVSTLNVLRNIYINGFMNLVNLDQWTHHLLKSDIKYQQIVSKVKNHLKFLESFKIDPCSLMELYSPQIYVSHECLLLDYEMSFVRNDSLSHKNFDCSGHMLWLGDRTRKLDSAHIEFLRGIENPIGIKCGPSTDINELVDIIQILNPTNEIGKIVIITRFGAANVQKRLDSLIMGLSIAKINVVYLCDPMHGNTFQQNGVKTRKLESILSEILQTRSILESHKCWLSGIHLEMTGDNVTECMGGIDEIDLSKNYQSICKPSNGIDIFNYLNIYYVINVWT